MTIILVLVEVADNLNIIIKDNFQLTKKKISNPFNASYKWSWFWIFCHLLILIIRLSMEPKRGWGGFQKRYYQFSPLLFSVGLCLIAPLWEEFVFRYLVFKVFGRKKIFSYLISFFGFVMMHFISETFAFKRFLGLSYYAIWLIFIYWLSDFNLFFPFFLHLLINLTIFCFKEFRC